MIRLFRSNLMRLKKSKLFYFMLICQAAIMLTLTLRYYFLKKSGFSVCADTLFSSVAVSEITAVLLAVFCSLFIGADYNYGTIRNKLIAGFPRSKIYLANLFTMLFTALCMNVAVMAVFFPVTLPLLGGFTESARYLVKIFVTGSLITAVYSSIYTAVAMMSKNTVVSLIVTVASFAVMSFVAMYLVSEINQPLTYTQMIENEFGEMITQTIPNPHRKSESVLGFYKILLNIFPSGQLNVLNSKLLSVWQSAVSAVCLIGISTVAGLTVFSEENIK